jgi:hypothetical protein
MVQDWRKPAMAVGVAALHGLFALFLIRMEFAPPPPESDAETTIFLLPLPPKPEEKKTEPSEPARSHAITIAQPPAFTLPPAWRGPNAPTAPGLGVSLGCAATNYDSLDKSQRAACGNGPWKYDAAARETASLIIKAPHVMSAADRAERIRSTVDPCAAEKLTHQTDCIYKVIYGDKLP